MKPFLTNKDCLDNSDIMLTGDNEGIADDKRLAKLFNEHYVNNAEQSSDLKKEKIVFHNKDFHERAVLHNIKKYKNQSSIIKIKNNMPVRTHLSSNNTLPSERKATSKEVNLILKSPNTKKASSTEKYRQNLPR